MTRIDHGGNQKSENEKKERYVRRHGGHGSSGGRRLRSIRKDTQKNAEVGPSFRRSAERKEGESNWGARRDLDEETVSSARRNDLTTQRGGGEERGNHTNRQKKKFPEKEKGDSSNTTGEPRSTQRRKREEARTSDKIDGKRSGQGSCHCNAGETSPELTR